MVIQTTYEQNKHLKDVLVVDLNITSLQNFQSHQKRITNVKIKYVVIKKVIVHTAMARIIVTKIYMHLWHACLLMKIFLVEILVTVHN